MTVGGGAYRSFTGRVSAMKVGTLASQSLGPFPVRPSMLAPKTSLFCARARFTLPTATRSLQRCQSRAHCLCLNLAYRLRRPPTDLRDYKKSLFRFGNLSVPWGPSLGAACDKARELGVDSLRGLKTRLSQAGND